MSPWQSTLLDAAFKSALLLAVAWLAVTFLRKTSAAARHLVWFLAVAALPLLPVLSWALPGWHVLPGWLDAKPRSTQIVPPREPVLAAPPPAEAPPVTEPMPRVAPRELPPTGHADPVPEPPKPQKQPVAAAVDYWRWTLVAWAGVALFALMPAFLGMMSLWRLEWGARRENEPGWLQLLHRLVERLRIRRRVHLLKSGRRRMPMTWGVIRPRLLLPEESRDWPEERRRVVLLHELAHAKRLDYLTNLVTQLACAIYWFNPLVWLAARRMAVERERACDDIVLNHGAKPADYAEQVLQIAAGLPVARFAALGGIPMARQSGLESRLRAILDGTRNRRALSRLVLLAMLAALALVVVPVAMLKAATAVAEPTIQTEVVFWQMAADKATVDELFPGSSFAGQTNYYAPKMLEGTNWFEVVRKAEAQGRLKTASSAIWLEPKVRSGGGPGILQRIDGLPGWEEDPMSAPMSQAMVNGFYTFARSGADAKLDLSDINLSASYSFHKSGSQGFVFYNGRAYSTKPIKWSGKIGAGQALAFVERFNGNLPGDLYHIAIFQTVASPPALAADLRGMTSGSRWVGDGPAGTLDEIRAARAWEEKAVLGGTNGGTSLPAFPAPSEALVQLVAIGQPARWPLRWWNADGAGVKGNSEWQGATGNAAFAVGIHMGMKDGMLDCRLRLPDNPPSGMSFASSSSPGFEPVSSVLSVTDSRPEEGELQHYLDRGGRVELVVKHGVGDWQEIGKIHANESNDVDGGHFTLAKVEKQSGTKLALIDAHFDYDPGFEIAFAAVDKRGQRSPVGQSSGSGNFEQRSNRWIYAMTSVGRDVDHFAILKRPVKEYVFTNIPTAPSFPVTRLTAAIDSAIHETTVPQVAGASVVAGLQTGARGSDLAAMLKAAAPETGRPGTAEASPGGNTNPAYRDPWGNPYIITMDTKGGTAPASSMTAEILNVLSAPPQQAGAISTNHLEFLPEIEKVLDTHGALGARAYLSFSNGVVAEESSAENPQRNRQLHRDLMLRTIEGEQEWTGVDLEVAAATEAMWNTPPDQLITALTDNLAPPLATMQVTPGVWFFKTRDGNYGLLRVVGFVESRPGNQAMKVVYKLAKPVPTQKQASAQQSLLDDMMKILGLPATNGATGDWGETKDGLRSRLVVETNVFQSGQPVRMRIEIQNIGGETKYIHNPTAPYFDDLQVFNAGVWPVVVANSQEPVSDVFQALTAGVRKVPFIGGPVQIGSWETNLNAGASAVFGPFDLSRFYYVRAPGKYTVKWKGQEEAPGQFGAPYPGRAFSAVLPSGELQFEVTASPDVADNAAVVGRLLPLLGSRGWLDDTATNLAVVGTTNEAQAPGPLWPEVGHYRKSAELRPGGNWTKVPGYGFVIHRDHYGQRMADTNYDPTVVWLWLTDTAAGPEPVLRDGLPGSDYLGKTSRWHVYVSMDASASNSWPTAKEDIKRALGGGQSVAQPTNAESSHRDPQSGGD